jgi:hypothetical protein
MTALGSQNEQRSHEECYYYLLLAKDLGCGLNIKIEYRIQETGE